MILIYKYDVFKEDDITHHMLCGLVNSVLTKKTRIPDSGILVIFLLVVFVDSECKLALQIKSVPLSEDLLRSVSFYVITKQKFLKQRLPFAYLICSVSVPPSAANPNVYSSVLYSGVQ